MSDLIQDVLDLREGSDDDMIRVLTESYLSQVYGPMGSRVFLTLYEAGIGEGMTIKEMVRQPRIAATGEHEWDLINNVRVAICALRKRMKKGGGSLWEIETIQKSNLEEGRYVLIEKTA